MHSAVDLTTALYNDVMDAWAQKKAAGIVTFDVHGAFDGVLAGSLCLRLREQGFPEAVTKWTRASFLTGAHRRVSMEPPPRRSR